MKPIVKIENLAKRFGKIYALKDVSFEIYPGEVVGFIGPNGAGKSTTIRIMLGLLKKSRGIVSLFDKDAWRDSLDIHRSVAYVPGDLTLWENLTGGQTIDLLMKLHGNGDETKKQELVKKFNLDLSKKVKSYSKGNRQKVGLIAALAVDCDLYILDEPTSGLDPLMQNEFVNLILEEKKRGKTILMSSHIFEEVEKTCNRVGIIKQGKIVSIEDIDTLRKSKHKIYAITFKNIKDIDRFKKENFSIKNINNNVVEVVIQNEINELIACLNNYQIINLDIVNQSLEEIFMHFYGGEVDHVQ